MREIVSLWNPMCLLYTKISINIEIKLKKDEYIAHVSCLPLIVLYTTVSNDKK